MLHTVRATLCAALIALTAALGLAVAPPAHAATGLVTGVLFDQGDSPLPGVEVKLIGSCAATCVTATDAAGKYRFEGLTIGGSYCLRFQGYTTPDYCFRATSGTLRLPGVQLAGSTVGTLRGKVTDPSGNPVLGATIEATGTFQASDTTGSFLFVNLAGGSYPVKVTMDGYAPKTLTATVTADHTTYVDVRLALATADRLPGVGFGTARLDHRLILNGTATDDIGIRQVRVAVKDLASGLWLRANGTWGARVLLNAIVASPGAASTAWTFKRVPFPAGRYGVQLVAIDTAQQRNAAPLPWKTFTVQP